MGSVNKVILVGNLGKDAELKYTPSGAAVTTISLATSEVWNDKASGQRRERREWHRVVIWGKTAEALAEYLTKGTQIYVDGQLQTRTWEQDGNKRYTTEIRGDRIVLLGSGPRREPNGGHVRDEEVGTPADPASQHAPLDDDIPF